MTALTFKLSHYSQSSGLENVCCLNIQILILVSFAASQGVVKITGPSCHQQTSLMERVSFKTTARKDFLRCQLGSNLATWGTKWKGCKDWRELRYMSPMRYFSVKTFCSCYEQLHILSLQGWLQMMHVGIRPGRYIVWKHECHLFDPYMNKRYFFFLTIVHGEKT